MNRHSFYDRSAASRQAAHRARYFFMRNLRIVEEEVMYRITPKIGRSGPHGRSNKPSVHRMPLYEFGSRPSTAYLLLSSTSVASAARGVADHSRIFLPHSMRR